MLADRDYMREEPESFVRWSPSITLIVVNIIVFLAQVMTPGHGRDIDTYFALSTEGLGRGYLWQLLTFQFLHGSLTHIVFNGLALYMFGRVVEYRLGPVSFLWLYLGSGVLGGLMQMAVAVAWPHLFGGSVLGASAGVCGLIAAFTLLQPNATLLLFFVIPARAKYVLIGSIVISIVMLVTASRPAPGVSGVAHAAHLGGFLGSILYIRWSSWFPGAPALLRRFQARPRWMPRTRIREMVSSGRSPKKSWRQRSAPSAPKGDFISREVDPILDKISAHGIQSLTPQEREILAAAREKMDPH